MCHYVWLTVNCVLRWQITSFRWIYLAQPVPKGLNGAGPACGHGEATQGQTSIPFSSLVSLHEGTKYQPEQRSLVQHTVNDCLCRLVHEGPLITSMGNKPSLELAGRPAPTRKGKTMVHCETVRLDCVTDPARRGR